MKDIKPVINWKWVKAQLLKKERIANNAIRKNADACLKKAALLVRPKMAMTIKKVIKFASDYIELEDNVKLHSKTLLPSLKEAGCIQFFIVTIGSKLEKEASSLMAEGEHLEGYLLDRIGSFAIESLAGDTEEKIRQLYKVKGLSVSMRFSPGYCDWPIEEQFTLTKILDFAKAGVTLTKSCMMVPQKSISAIVGIGEEEAFSKKAKSQCVICDKVESCDYSRI